MNQYHSSSRHLTRHAAWFISVIMVACTMVAASAKTLEATVLDDTVEQPSAVSASVFPSEVSSTYSEWLAQPEALGSARLTYLFFDVYDATLWVEQPMVETQPLPAQDWQTLAPLVLELKYLRKLHGDKIAERSLKEMNDLGLDNAEQQQRWLEFMLTTFPTVTEGDVIAGAYAVDGQTAFYLNGEKIGEIEDPAFGQFFFAIWLDADTSEPDMREQLLGLATD